MSFTARRTLTVPSFDPDTLLGNPSRTPIGKEERERLLLDELRKLGRLDFPEGLVPRSEYRPGKGPDFLLESLSGRTATIELTELSAYKPQAPSTGSLSRASSPTTMPPNPDRWAIVSDSEHWGTVVPPTLRKCPGAARKT